MPVKKLQIETEAETAHTIELRTRHYCKYCACINSSNPHNPPNEVSTIIILILEVRKTDKNNEEKTPPKPCPMSYSLGAAEPEFQPRNLA